MAFIAEKVNLSTRVREHLEQIAREQKAELRLVTRARIVLYAASGHSNAWIQQKMTISRDTCSKWRRRFVRAAGRLHRTETEAPEKLAEEVREVLSDARRSGRPRIFTGEQIACIMKRACQKPSGCGYARNRWTCSLLAEDAVKTGIVQTISPRTIARYLNEAAIRPWNTRYWLHSPDKDENPDSFRERISEICDVYLQARTLRGKGVHVVCADEKTGIQALEHRYLQKPAAPGLPALTEFEYIRHGTLALIAGIEVSDGKILPARIGKTRKEADFVAAIRKMTATDPNAEWIFIVDGLNTHKSESLVRFVAEECSIECNLGKKGTTGILRNMASREAFLHDETHRIRFIYTPRHCSWINQVEIWFGTLSRRFLRNRSSVSVNSLDAGIRKFIRQYNLTAEPYKWTYTGVPLAA